MDAAKRTSKSKRAGLQLPVHTVNKKLKTGNYAKRIRTTASVYMTAVMEYITAEVLEVAGDVASEHKKTRISPRHILLAVRHDHELSHFFQDVHFSEAGVLRDPNYVQEALEHAAQKPQGRGVVKKISSKLAVKNKTSDESK